jgi:hypothetical protein
LLLSHHPTHPLQCDLVLVTIWIPSQRLTQLGGGCVEVTLEVEAYTTPVQKLCFDVAAAAAAAASGGGGGGDSTLSPRAHSLVVELVFEQQAEHALRF